MRIATRAALRAAIAAGLLCAAYVAAQAKPPPGADLNSPIAHWYESLMEPRGGMVSCCGAGDCRPVQFRSVGLHYEAFIDKAKFGDKAPDAWVAVPDETIIRDKPNPTGSAVACAFWGHVICFILPSMT